MRKLIVIIALALVVVTGGGAVLIGQSSLAYADGDNDGGKN